jgi:hypothetical protein
MAPESPGANGIFRWNLLFFYLSPLLVTFSRSQASSFVSPLQVMTCGTTFVGHYMDSIHIELTETMIYMFYYFLLTFPLSLKEFLQHIIHNSSHFSHEFFRRLYQDDRCMQGQTTIRGVLEFNQLTLLKLIHVISPTPFIAILAVAADARVPRVTLDKRLPHRVFWPCINMCYT